MHHPPWKSLSLSLERPYKDDDDITLPILYDIAPDGQCIYQPKESLTTQLGDRLGRIFLERGVDFFEKVKGSSLVNDSSPSLHSAREQGDLPVQQDDKTDTKIMTIHDLCKMRNEMLPHLYTALGEMSHARDLLSSLLASTQTSQSSVLSPQATTESSPSTHLSATVVTKPLSILSVQAFNAQLTIGGKDEALRKAAEVFKNAAESMEKSRQRSEKYWSNALKIRRANWGLVPAPLPLGSSTAKGADRTSKDFLVAYGLEESPSFFRRQAVAHMAAYANESDNLIFPQRRHTRLLISLAFVNENGSQQLTHSIIKGLGDDDLNKVLQTAQQEIIEHEIFSLLVKEAATLPTASARVSERLISIDPAPGVELQFELVGPGSGAATHKANTINETAICDLIYCALQVLLLRRHTYIKMQRLNASNLYKPSSTSSASRPPPLLQPIIDLLQYQIFCKRIKIEIDKMIRALAAVGIASTLRFTSVGETGKDLIGSLDKGVSSLMSGEAVIQIDNRHGIRLSFTAPSTLTAHLPQATLSITSVPQLCQLLMDEVERCLVHRISDIGKDISEGGGAWFVDLNSCIGRWDGCALNFRIHYGNDFAINCTAFRLDGVIGQEGHREIYSDFSKNISLLDWVTKMIQLAAENRSWPNISRLTLP
ncbi:hypothetical protein AMATHDRAFT_45989 [Amanita thiersii Skay4041]|uniref:Mediator of RNA polymerase II transcription subunit 17 n=1 Tax=Amanita thiersii Skay4041 TaxID=703135 RepID=A0A2A9NY37_9AGAR|nr:hypothetical protein AMATHDRAFT_45989 [Amanita thiersii Skay4041]